MDFMKKGQLIPLEGTPASMAFATRKPVLRDRPDFESFPHPIMKQAYASGIGLNPKNETVSYDTLAGKETASGKATIYEGVP